jgi:magnesium chelatase family protein
VLAVANAFTLVGLDAVPVEIEAHVQPGVPAFTIVGLPDKAVQEARERVAPASRRPSWCSRCAA